LILDNIELAMTTSTSPSVAPPPVIFRARGLNPDVCLEVFGTKFHVHSVVLKLHSHFFLTFFGSDDKAGGSTGGMGSFAYEWLTKVLDEGKEWMLVCKGQNVSSWWHKV
jgi:hypothetical protein